MRLTRIVLIVTNLALLAAFWALASELQFIPGSDHATYKRNPVSLPAPGFRPDVPALDRSLFRTKPILSEPNSSSSASSSRPNIRLLGIVRTAERQVAVIELDGSTLRVEEGGDVNGWQITIVEPRRIRLESAGHHVDVPLDPPNDVP